ncbi:hypothetical protein M406DRAFT_80190, partial [Cryphonectria parasitica EP155]
MTDNLATPSTLPAPSSLTVYPFDKPSSKDATLKVKPKKEEDSIQCICDFSGDDGNTIFCEECKTWQHIACYYPGRETEALEEEFRHSCADCEPRELDKRKAVERMMQVKLGIQPLDCEIHDKKAKKPPSKSHKKKIKPNDLHLNGHLGTDGHKHGSPPDHPPTKKAKTSHKSSHSVSAAPASRRSPSHSAPKANHHGHPLSPATTPPDVLADFEFSAYTPRFLSLYDDPVEIVDTNTIATLKTTDRMSLWSRPEGAAMFRQDTRAEFDEVVQRKTPSPLQPPLRVERRELHVSKDIVLSMPHLVTSSPVDQQVPMIELNGLVGLQKDYCDDSNNRYKELSAPLPFVFFPSHIPLYIDTRREGSNARYVRRSCRPNARLLTYLSDDSDWHFWLVSERPIDANEEVTVGWDISLLPPYRARLERLLNHSGEEANEHSATDVVADMEQSEYDALSHSITSVTMEYGGCACDLGSHCAFARFDRPYHDKSQHRPNAPKRKRAKSKAHTISPTSTSQATNSRAASENHLDEMPDHDHHSSAESSRSKPPSRDRTPARLGSFDTLGILTEPTNRDKRKVQIAENLFQKSAQEEQLPRKKKKSVDAPAALSNASRSKNRSSTSHASERINGTDTGTSGSKVVSPVSIASRALADTTPNVLMRHPSAASVSPRRSPSSTLSSYCDAAVQTEAVAVKYPFQQPAQPRPPRRRIISLTTRLMLQKQRVTSSPPEPSSAMDLDTLVTTKSPQGSPTSVLKQTSLSSPTSTGDDAPMPDADSITIADDTGLSQTNGADTTVPIKVKSPELRVQMPPVPIFTSPPSAAAISTPVSSHGSMVHSPFSATNLANPFAPPAVNGVAAHPSPIKKKMSLSEYKNKANKAAA